MPLLEIKNLSVSIPTPEGDVHAVRAVSLDIERGEMTDIDLDAPEGGPESAPLNVPQI